MKGVCPRVPHEVERVDAPPLIRTVGHLLPAEGGKDKEHNANAHGFGRLKWSVIMKAGISYKRFFSRWREKVVRSAG